MPTVLIFLPSFSLSALLSLVINNETNQQSNICLALKDTWDSEIQSKRATLRYIISLGAEQNIDNNWKNTVSRNVKSHDDFCVGSASTFET